MPQEYYRHPQCRRHGVNYFEQTSLQRQPIPAMGTFMGHIVPGTFFFLFGLWYVVQIYRRYYTCLQRRAQFVSTHTFQCDCLCGRLQNLPVESFVKLLFVIIGFSGEIITAFDDSGNFYATGNGQHATMFFFFGLSGIMDILMFYRVPLPSDLDYVFSTVAFFIEWLLFTFHLHGRTELDILVHKLLIYAIFLNMLAVMVEMKYRQYVLSPLARAFFFILQGTWFWQVGFILYNPLSNSKWKPDDHDEMLLVTMIFTWHCAMDLLLMLFIGAVIAVVYKRRGILVPADEDDMPLTSLLQHRSNGQTIVRLGSEDDESDIEFQRPVR